MKGLRLKFLTGFLIASLILTSCQNQAAELPDVSGGISTACSFEAMEQHDEAWWWENYLQGQVYQFQHEFPHKKEDDNWEDELYMLFCYGYRQGILETSDVDHYNVKLPKETLNELAPIVLNKPDISHIYTDYMEDEEGYIHHYGNFKNIFKQNYGSTPTGDWAFNVESAEYPTPYTAKITVKIKSSDPFSYRRIFNYEQNEFDHYVLKSVECSHQKEPLDFQGPPETKIYDADSSSKNFYNFIGESCDKSKLVSAFFRYGICQYSVFDAENLEKEPVTRNIYLDKDESMFLEAQLREDDLFISSDKKIRKISLLDGKILKEVEMPKHFSELYEESDRQYPYGFIFDDDLNYVSYSNPEGLFLAEFASDKVTKISDNEANRYHQLKVYPKSLKDGKLYYYNNYSASLTDLGLYDKDKGKEVPLDIDFPENIRELEEVHQIFNNKAIYRYDTRGESPKFVAKVCDLETGQTFSIEKQPERDNSFVYFNDNNAFLLSTDLDEGDPVIYKLNINDGSIEEEIFSMKGLIGSINFYNGHIMMASGENIIVVPI